MSQREHYIPGSCLTTASRWARLRPPNALLAGVALVLIAMAVTAGLLDAELAAAVLAILAAVVAAVLPWPMTVLGTEVRLNLTRRARTLAVIALLLSAGGVALVVLVGALSVATAVVAVAMPALVDAAAAVARPIEGRMLERHRRRAEARLRQVDPFVIAVTGSWGKTSTKGHISDLIAGSAEVVASPASWNNTAGLSRTINEHLGDRTEVLVAEMGMYGPGEIRRLCAWVPPRIAVITAVGPMHLERVGSIVGIVAAKSEILEGADVAVLWVEDAHLAALADATSVPDVWRVGTRGGSNLRVEVERQDDRIVVWAEGDEVGSIPAASGVHPGNAGCAVAVALAYGVPSAVLARRLEALVNPAHRATVAVNDNGVTVMDDTFNANPAGALAAVDALAATVAGRRVVVTPGMVELGSEQDAQNEALAHAAVASGATLLAVGWTNRSALIRGSGDQAVTVPSRAEALDWVRAHLGPGDGVLWENDLPDHYP